MVAGVCGGLGEHFGIDPTLVRLLFVVAVAFGGSGIVLYLVLWALVPPASRLDAPGRDVVRDNVEEARRVGEDLLRSAREAFDDVRGSRRTGSDDDVPPPPPPSPA